MESAAVDCCRWDYAEDEREHEIADLKRRLVEAEHKAREAAARAAEELRAVHAELQVGACGHGWAAGTRLMLDVLCSQMNLSGWGDCCRGSVDCRLGGANLLFELLVSAAYACHDVWSHDLTVQWTAVQHSVLSSTVTLDCCCLALLPAAVLQAELGRSSSREPQPEQGPVQPEAHCAGP